VGRRYRPRVGSPVSQPPRGLRHPKQGGSDGQARGSVAFLVTVPER
jgi:hypothetical protein